MSQSPLLIHVGFQRTLTTWLQHQFFAHEHNDFQLIGGRDAQDHKSRISEVFSKYGPYHDYVSTLKELFEADIKAVQQAGKVPVISNEDLCGNTFAGSYDSKVIADALKGAFPDAKILIGFREQSDLIFSHWLRHISSGGGEDIMSYISFSRRKYPIFRLESYMFYDCVSYYQKLFGKSNVLAQPLELFSAEPERLSQQYFALCDLSQQSYGDVRAVQIKITI